MRARFIQGGGGGGVKYQYFKIGLKYMCINIYSKTSNKKNLGEHVPQTPLTSAWLQLYLFFEKEDIFLGQLNTTKYTSKCTIFLFDEQASLASAQHMQ